MTTFNDLPMVAGWIGEMLGTFVLTLGSLLSIFVVKSGTMGLDTKLKQRGVLAIGVAISVILGLELSKGLGGHGQLNMGVTLLVMIGKLNIGQIAPDGGVDAHGEATYYGHGNEMLNDALPVIGFQLIGAVLGAAIMLLVAKLSGRWDKMSSTFTHNSQSVQRTMGVEALGNVFWMLTIAGMLGMVMHGNAQGFGFWTLMITAGMAKVLIILVVDDFGGAMFNVTYWFGKWIVVLVSQKGFPKSGKTWLADGLTVVLNLGISSAAGAIFLGVEMLRF